MYETENVFDETQEEVVDSPEDAEEEIIEEEYDEEEIDEDDDSEEVATPQSREDNSKYAAARREAEAKERAAEQKAAELEAKSALMQKQLETLTQATKFRQRFLLFPNGSLFLLEKECLSSFR